MRCNCCGRKITRAEKRAGEFYKPMFFSGERICVACFKWCEIKDGRWVRGSAKPGRARA